MANKTVNELPASSVADLSTNDQYLIWDSETSTTRKVSLEDQATGVKDKISYINSVVADSTSLRTVSLEDTLVITDSHDQWGPVWTHGADRFILKYIGDDYGDGVDHRHFLAYGYSDTTDDLTGLVELLSIDSSDVATWQTLLPGALGHADLTWDHGNLVLPNNILECQGGIKLDIEGNFVTSGLNPAPTTMWIRQLSQGSPNYYFENTTKSDNCTITWSVIGSSIIGSPHKLMFGMRNSSTYFGLDVEQTSGYEHAANTDVSLKIHTDAAGSDERLKDNIVDMSDKLEDIMRLRTRNFTMTDKLNKIPEEKGKPFSGFIAQEVAEIFPSLVIEDPCCLEDEDYLVIKRDSLVWEAFLVKAIQERQEIIEAQNEQIEILIKRVDHISEVVTDLLPGDTRCEEQSFWETISSWWGSLWNDNAQVRHRCAREKLKRIAKERK